MDKRDVVNQNAARVPRKGSKQIQRPTRELVIDHLQVPIVDEKAATKMI